jgi:hypothetical protein
MVVDLPSINDSSWIGCELRATSFELRADRIPAVRGLSGGAKDETIPDKIEQRSS